MAFNLDRPIRPVIMCGGSGTRLWPASREAFPKQFAPLIGARSTFQETLSRVSDASLFGKPLVVTNTIHRFMVEQQMAEIGLDADILLEPIARDSGPAILAASLLVAQQNSDALIMVLAADHVVLNVPAFKAAVRSGIEAAMAGRIVTFGILPNAPATSYGYIEAGRASIGDTREVVRFVEKPDAATAQTYVEAGYLWNSGNFLFSPTVMIAEYAGHDTNSVDYVQAALDRASIDLGVPILDEANFAAAGKISIDYAVMERTKLATVVAGEFGWSDIGGWDALWAVTDHDSAANAAVGDVMFIESRNSYASSDGQLVAVLGMTDVVVVATRDAVLVTTMSRSGEVKGLVEQLKKAGRAEAIHHARVYRPWGWYRTLEREGRFQTKRIVVYPNGRLSLQKHMHRSEHWIVVKGVATVVVDEVLREISENESIYIPRGAKHSLENCGKIDLEIIEIQTGSYLGEDDIIRLEDIYNRY
ncbi:MAG TPA: mannose-1-phosphate guanylyltransferase/mannose-6-phosphate isomerase [Bosea sp. (in: a-proteobacteria)]